MAEYMKATGSLLAGVAAVMAVYNIGDGHGLARDGLLGHMSVKNAGKQFGEEAAKSFKKIQHEHEVHLGDRDRTWWRWMSGSKRA